MYLIRDEADNLFLVPELLPKDGKPITNWNKIDDATLNVASGIVDEVHRLIAEDKVP